MMEQKDLYNNEDGVSIKEIFSWIWAKKLIGLILACFVLLIVVLGVVFFYNPMKAVYSIRYQYGGIPNLDQGTYVDGSVFNYFEIVSEEAIFATIEKDESFSSLKNGVEGAQFSISYTPKQEEQTTLEEYVISVNANFFSNEKQAKAFLVELAKYPLYKTTEILNQQNYDYNLTQYESVDTFEEQLAYLTNQVNFLIANYDLLISYFGDASVDVQGSNAYLSQIKQELSKVLTDADTNFSLTVLQDELSYNGYVKDYTKTKALYEKQLATLKEKIYEDPTDPSNDSYLIRRLKKLESQQEALLNQTNGSTVVTTEALKDIVNQIAQINAEIAQIEDEIRILTKKLENIALVEEGKGETFLSDSQTFAGKMDNLKRQLEQETELYKTISKNLFETNMQIYFMDAKVITETGSINLILTGIIGIVGGVLVGGVVAGILGYRSEKKKEEKELKTE